MSMTILWLRIMRFFVFLLTILGRLAGQWPDRGASSAVWAGGLDRNQPPFGVLAIAYSPLSR
jgi:hypothetical protein